MAVQDPRLRLATLGIIGSPHVQDGVHLRWTIAPELGFPPEGFNLFIRPHRQQDPKTAIFANVLPRGPAPIRALVTEGVTVHDAEGELLQIRSFCDHRGLLLSDRPLIVRFRPRLAAPPQLAREVTLFCVSRGGGAFAQARYKGEVADCAGAGSCLPKLLSADLLRQPVMFDDEPLLPGRFLLSEALRTELSIVEVEKVRRKLAEQELRPVMSRAPSCKVFSITLRADAIDEVRVTGCGEAMLAAVQYTKLSKDEEHRGWKPLAGPICLPIEEMPDYPCSESPVSGRDRAKMRLPEDAEQPALAPTKGELVDRLLGTEFDELQESLRKMWADSTPQHLQIVKIESDDPDDETTYRLQTISEVLLGCFDPYFARIIGLYHVDKQLSGTWDYKVEAHWPVGGSLLRLAWIAFDVAPSPQPPLAAPTGAKAEAIPGLSRVSEDGVVSPFQMDVGVSWNRPTACDLTDAAHAFAIYHIQRTAANAPVTGPYKLVTERSFDPNQPPEPVALIFTDSQSDGEQYPLAYFLDRGPGYGRFHYRVLAHDLFGRLSGLSNPATVIVRDIVPPPPPVNLQAVYFDPADEELTGSEVLAWANRDTTPGDPLRPGVLLRWTWPIARQQQAPDLSEFRLYYRHGLLNAVSGAVEQVTSLGGDRYRVQTDLPSAGPDFPTSPAAVDLGTLRNEGEEFVIETIVTVGGQLAFEVTANPQAPPIAGRCTFQLGAGQPARGGTPALPPHPVYLEYRDPADWLGLVLDAAFPGPHHPLRIRSNGSVTSPLPIGLNTSDVEATRMLEPDSGGSHWHYELRLRALTLSTTRDRPRVSGAFGITAVDDATPENESRVSPPASIFAVHRQPPDVPTLSFPDEVFATPADFFGRSYFNFEWIAERNVGYLVYRASDVQLLEEAGVPLSDHQNLSPGEQRLQLLQLGSQQANLEAFSTVTPQPIYVASNGPMHYRDQLDGALSNRFVYRLRSIDRSGNLAAWPADPPPADAGTVCVVVALPPVTPPSRPTWAGTEARDEGLALRWNPTSAPGVHGYRLYRTRSAEDASDTRSMQPLFTTATSEGSSGIVAVRVGRSPEGGIDVSVLAPGETPSDRLLQFVDTSAPGGLPLFYRLVAEDQFGNRSLPAEVLSVRHPKRRPPAPPTWSGLDVTDDGILLEWSADEDDLVSLVLRRTHNSDEVWRALGTWNPAGEYQFLDTDAEEGVTYEYRIRLRDRVGHIVEGPVLSGIGT